LSAAYNVEADAALSSGDMFSNYKTKMIDPKLPITRTKMIQITEIVLIYPLSFKL